MKRLFLIVSAVLVTIFVCGDSVYADDIYLGINGDGYGEYEGNPEYYSEEQRIMREELNNKIANHPIALTGSIKTLDVIGFEQTTDYYCGPANVQAIVNYKTGKIISQSTLASSMGTTSSSGTSRLSIVNELNNRIGAGSYIDVTTSSVDLGPGIQYSIDKDYPLIYNVYPIGNLTGYDGYQSSGHYVFGYGYKFGWSGTESYSEIDYFDPFRSSKGSYGQHTISLSKMRTATDEKAGHYIMTAK